METLSYSFHLGNDGNKSRKAKAKSKNNLSGTTSFANNAIQNYQQLSKVSNHDFRKYDGDTEYIYGLRGTNDVVSDVKELYLDMFEESRIEYNSKQSRPSRMINDYFKHVSDDEQKDLACEIIIELGNKDFWDTKNLDYKQKMVNVFNQQLKDLEHKAPDFKICSAVVHLDEGSPHMHVVGVPIKYNNTRGMNIQVGKSAVFTKEKLEKLQDYMREKCINTYNEVYGLNDEHKAELKEKQKGRAFNIHVKDMANYNEIMNQLEVNKKSIKESDELVDKIDKTSKELDEIFYDIEPDEFNNYKLTEKQIVRFIELNDEVQRMEEVFLRLKEIYQNINKVKGNVEYLNKRNNELIKKNDELADMNQRYERKIKNYEGSEELLKTYIHTKDKEHLELVTYLCKHANSNDYTTSRFYKQLSDDLYQKGFIKDKEHSVIFNPPKIINRSEINKAINSINKEMDEAAEEFYKMNSNNNDYSI